MRLKRTTIPRLAMAAFVKQLVIVVCLIGLMAGSLCQGYIHGKTLNRQEQEKVPTPVPTASTRRFPLLSGVYHLAPLKPAAPKQNYNPPSQPVPQEYDALPGPVTTKQNQDAYKSVNCHDRRSGGVRRRRKAFVRKYEN